MTVAECCGPGCGRPGRTRLAIPAAADCPGSRRACRRADRTTAAAGARIGAAAGCPPPQPAQSAQSAAVACRTGPCPSPSALHRPHRDCRGCPAFPDRSAARPNGLRSPRGCRARPDRTARPWPSVVSTSFGSTRNASILVPRSMVPAPVIFTSGPTRLRSVVVAWPLSILNDAESCVRSVACSLPSCQPDSVPEVERADHLRDIEALDGAVLEHREHGAVEVRHDGALAGAGGAHARSSPASCRRACRSRRRCAAAAARARRRDRCAACTPGWPSRHRRSTRRWPGRHRRRCSRTCALSTPLPSAASIAAGAKCASPRLISAAEIRAWAST